MSVHTDDAVVSMASVLSSVAEVLNGDERSERSERVEGGVSVPVPRWPYSFAVSSKNSCVNESPDSSFMFGLRSLVCLNLFLRAGVCRGRWRARLGVFERGAFWGAREGIRGWIP